MKTDSTPRDACWRRRLLCPALAALSFGLALAARAETPAAGAIRITPPLDASPYAEQEDVHGELLVLVCRPGRMPIQQQQMQQDLPLLCLVTQADEQALRMGPDRFQQLLDKAVDSGAVVVLVRPRE